MIDEQGRVFGKINAIDALAILIVVVLIPVAYGAYALFRTPIPTIVSIEPPRLVKGNAPAVTVQGQNLRPFLRAQIGTTPPTIVPFLIESPGLGQVKLPDLAPGSYDLVLYDEAREVARKPGAIVVVASPEVAEVRVRFVAQPEMLAAIKVGDVDVTGGATDAERAVLTGLGTDRQSINVTVGTEAIHRRAIQLPETMQTFTGTLRVPVVWTPTGWNYHDHSIKIGAAFNFETLVGVMIGSIVDVKVPEQK